ncbi:MAG: hypothetical protein H0T46_08280 [Deltaproteobacteria bacterium]|nr:hypothetical protein [Deltaproteobacteria bacterium]
MRRVPRAAGLVLVTSSLAHAAPWSVTLEGGAEQDTNVQRVETGPGLDTERIASSVVRIGGKLDRRDRIAGGNYALVMSALARMVGDDQASSENVMLFAGELRYLRPIEDRRVSFGVGFGGVNAVPITNEIGARTFINLAADGLLVLDGGEGKQLTVGFGWRDFTYKENREFDWTGPAATARLDLWLWAPSDGTRSVELAAIAGFESREYNSTALVNACPPGAPPSDSCSAGTSRTRRDRSQRIGAEVTYTGRTIATLGYQLTVIDSNSFGQSLIRHRTTGSVTRSLPWGLFGTALAILQIDQFVDGLVVKKDLQRSEFTSLDDENRSSLQLRLGKPVSGKWTVETRGAIWRELGGTMDTSFRRASIYVGAIYAR